MLQNYNKWTVLKLFFDNPLPETAFQLREISRKSNLAPKSVKRYLIELEKEDLIIKHRHRIHKYPVYKANRDNENFKFFKTINTLIIIRESGLLELLNNECMPAAIVLFGSAAKGEDLEDSDLDIFCRCKYKKLDLKKYEKKIKRKINLLFEENFNKLSDELKNNIINGIKLKGYLKVF